MGQTLSNGLYLPDEGERNSYAGLEANWRTLDALILTVDGKAAPNVANTWTAAQTFTAGIVGDLTGNVTGNLTGIASRATGDEDGTNIKTGYVNVAGNQTVTGDKSFTGSNTFNNILPNATNTYSLGSSSYQWSSVYAQTYYYNGTAWGLDKANVWSATNTYSTDSYFKLGNYEQGEIPSSSRGRLLYFTDKNDATIGWIQNRVEASGERSLELYVANKFTNNQPDINGSGVYNIFKIGLKANSTRYTEIMGDAYPRNNSVYSLGTSTNKWKTLNGVNPGALSLPDVSNSVNIDTTGWITDGSVWNTITSSSLIDGYLYINYSQCSADDYISVRLRNSSYQNLTFCFLANTDLSGNHFLYASVPVSKQFNVFIEIKTTGTFLKACIFPMQGNV